MRPPRKLPRSLSAVAKNLPSEPLSPQGTRRLAAPARDLGLLITTWRAEAEVLRRRADDRASRLLESCADEVAAVSDDFTTWYSEEEASRRAGWTRNQVRRHARDFAHTEHVRLEKRGEYWLRACIVPHPAPLAVHRGDTA